MVPRTLTSRQANIPHAIAIECVGWDTHPLYDRAYDGAVDGLLRGARQFDGDRFREDQFDAWLIYCARREAWNRVKRHKQRKIKKDHVCNTDYYVNINNLDNPDNEEGPIDDAPGPLEEIIEGEEWAFLHKAIGSLAPEDWKLLQAYFSGKATQYAHSRGWSCREYVYQKTRKLIARLREMAERECL